MRRMNPATVGLIVVIVIIVAISLIKMLSGFFKEIGHDAEKSVTDSFKKASDLH